MLDRQRLKFGKMAGALVTSVVAILVVVLLATGQWSLATFLFTSDQAAHRYYQRGEYERAAELFIDPMWKGIAYFKLGEFVSASNHFADMATAEAVFNHGNALVMQGKYDEAVVRYNRALELKPGWEDAVHNRKIAQSRSEMLRKEGDEMTGGQLGADEIVFSEGQAPPSAQEEQIQDQQQLNDEAIRAMWLRNVQTKSADFLRAKFAYQYSKGKNE